MGLSKVNKLHKYLVGLCKVELLRHFSSLHSFLKFKPHSAMLHITDTCCFRCIMCGQWKQKTDDELSTEKWFDILFQLRKNGIKSISLSGGEPFMRNDIVDIISYANKIGLDVGIITNGYLLDREIIENTVKAGVASFSISIDGVGVDFDNIRGTKGAYQKVLDSCKILSEYRIKHGYIYFTLMQNTLNNYKDVFAIAEEFGFSFVVNLFDYTPYLFKDLKKTKDLFWIDNGSFSFLESFQKFISGKKQNNPKSTYNTYSEIKYFKDYFKDPLQKKIPCIVSQQRIGIDSQGNVYGGCLSMKSFGNLKEKSLKNIINTTKYKAAHKDMFFKRCPGCSCGYSINMRHFLPVIIKESIFRLAPSFRRRIYPHTN